MGLLNAAEQETKHSHSKADATANIEQLQNTIPLPVLAPTSEYDKVHLVVSKSVTFCK
jgi:hypothetical protein